jgi:hypothetical protein
MLIRNRLIEVMGVLVECSGDARQKPMLFVIAI